MHFNNMRSSADLRPQLTLSSASSCLTLELFRSFRPKMHAFIVPAVTTTTATRSQQYWESHLCPPRRPHRNLTETTKTIPKAGLSTPPPPSSFHDAASGNDNLHWKDRVALYAQFSAEETLHVLLHALQSNAHSGPYKDDGIDALYAFSNVDVWELSHKFFGKTQDLGQFERFKRVVVAHPYNTLLRNDYKSKCLSALHVTPDVYVTRKVFKYYHGLSHVNTVFTFTMCRLQFAINGSGDNRAWMVDSIIHGDDDNM